MIQAVEDEKAVESIEVIKYPDKMQYIKGQDGWWSQDKDENPVKFFYDVQRNATGLGLLVKYSEGAPDEYYYDNEGYFFIEGEKVEFSTEETTNIWDVGSHRITVAYKNKTTDYMVEVIESLVSEILLLELWRNDYF